MEGDPFVLFQQFRLFGDAAVTGNTLMTDTCDPVANSLLLTSSTGDVANIPADATVEAAYLFWSATHPFVDNTATLTLPSGSSQSVSATQACHFVNMNLNAAITVQAYGCVSDATAFIATQGNSLNGSYRIGNVDGSPALLDQNCTPLENGYQAKFAGWSLIIVYSSPSDCTQRDVFVYDGFRSFDEAQNSAGQESFTISGFNVGNPPDAKLSFFSLEGDRQLGIPPQNFAVGGAACPDGSGIHSMQFNGILPLQLHQPARQPV